MKLTELEERLKELHTGGIPAAARDAILGPARMELSRTWADRFASSGKLWATLATSFALVLALLYGERIRHCGAMCALLPPVKEAKPVELPEMAMVPGMADFLARRTESIDPMFKLSCYYEQIQALLETDYNSESGGFRRNG